VLLKGRIWLKGRLIIRSFANSITDGWGADGPPLIKMPLHGLDAVLCNALSLPLGKVGVIAQDHLPVGR